jgi:DtxR family Mn-dependent transcriptional regulator
MQKLPVVSLAQEDCLEAVLRLQQSQGAARIGELAAALGVHKSTVVAMVKRLAARELLTHARYGLVTLTATGATIAGRTGARHELIRELLMQVLLLDEQAADANACRLEHALDAAAHQRLREAVSFAATKPTTATNWQRAFRAYLAAGKPSKPSKRGKGGAQ